MTTRLNRLTQAGCIVLLFMLFPGISLSQEQNGGPVAQQPENAAKPAPQDQASPGIAVTPEKQPQEQTEPQEGAALPADRTRCYRNPLLRPLRQPPNTPSSRGTLSGTSQTPF